eukprot:scaffold190660_cov17-Tisochrysis_lutea.AAC.1
MDSSFVQLCCHCLHNCVCDKIFLVSLCHGYRAYALISEACLHTAGPAAHHATLLPTIGSFMESPSPSKQVLISNPCWCASACKHGLFEHAGMALWHVSAYVRILATQEGLLQQRRHGSEGIWPPLKSLLMCLSIYEHGNKGRATSVLTLLVVRARPVLCLPLASPAVK